MMAAKGDEKRVVNLIFRNGPLMESTLLKAQVDYSEAGEILMVVLDIDDDMADVLRRIMLRMKSRNAKPETENGVGSFSPNTDQYTDQERDAPNRG